MNRGNLVISELQAVSIEPSIYLLFLHLDNECWHGGETIAIKECELQALSLPIITCSSFWSPETRQHSLAKDGIKFELGYEPFRWFRLFESHHALDLPIGNLSSPDSVVLKVVETHLFQILVPVRSCFADNWSATRRARAYPAYIATLVYLHSYDIQQNLHYHRSRLSIMWTNGNIVHSFGLSGSTSHQHFFDLCDCLGRI